MNNIKDVRKRLYVAEQILNELVAYMEHEDIESLYSPSKGVTSLNEIKFFLKLDKNDNNK